jgi:hypothetical protein
MSDERGGNEAACMPAVLSLTQGRAANAVPRSAIAFRVRIMSLPTVLLPLFVEVALTFALLFWMARSRVHAVKSKQVRMADVALGQLNWPPRVQQISNSYHSQFQVPVLFYVLTILEIITRHADLLFVVLAWLFVASRVVQAYIHTTSNFVPRRFNAFAVGVFVLVAMWAIFAVRIFLGLP